MIITYPIITKSVIVENDFSIIRISSLRVVISVKKKLITSAEVTFFIRKTSFIEVSRIVIMNEYRPSHINIKNVIVFAFLKMKKVYNARH